MLAAVDQMTDRTNSNTATCCFVVPGGATEARLAVLFAGGAFGVWELDSRLDLRQVRCSPACATAVLLLGCCASHLQSELTRSTMEEAQSPAGCCWTAAHGGECNSCRVQGPVTVAAAARVGRVIDIAWAPLPAPVGGGAVLLAATDDGGVAVLDACQAADAAPRRLRYLAVGVVLLVALPAILPLPLCLAVMSLVLPSCSRVGGLHLQFANLQRHMMTATGYNSHAYSPGYLI